MASPPAAGGGASAYSPSGGIPAPPSYGAWRHPWYKLCGDCSADDVFACSVAASNPLAATAYAHYRVLGKGLIATLAVLMGLATMYIIFSAVGAEHCDEDSGGKCDGLGAAMCVTRRRTVACELMIVDVIVA